MLPRWPLTVTLIGVTCLLLTTSAVRLSPAAAQQASGVPLRQVDWDSFLPTDPLVQSSDQPCIPPPPEAQLGPCVSVSLAQPVPVNGLSGPSGPAVTDFTGFADTAHILYADLDGDGQEEAVIPTQSTGTGGSFGFLVYHQAEPGPKLVVAYPGYKLGVSLDQGRLVVSQPFYFGFEANCCPTALTVHSNLLDNAGLYDAAGVGYSLFDDGGNPRPATPAEITVAAFYRAVDGRAFDVAYGLVSPEVRARRTFETFTAGYATTRGVSATVAPGEAADEVRVSVISVDEGPNGEMVTKHFAGSWFVSVDVDAPFGVYLIRAAIQEVAQ